VEAVSPVNINDIDPSPIFDSDPIPLTGTHPTPKFPVGALPAVLSEMVEAVAEATQTDPAMPATTALTVLAAAVGGYAEIEVRPGWREGLNIYTATMAAPGERKSAVQATMTQPLRAVEAALAAEGVQTRREAETLRHIAEKSADRAKQEAARAAGPDKDRLRAEAVDAALTAEAMTVPPVPRILADDITGEAVASLLAEQSGRLAVVSAEGGIFEAYGLRGTRVIRSASIGKAAIPSTSRGRR
jgi:hypothetical protein